MNRISCEAFINICDELMIPAEEGLFKKTKVTIKQARDIKTESEMKSNMYGEEPILHLTGPNKHQLRNIFKKMKSKGTWGSVSSGINAANGYNHTSYCQSKDIENSGQADAMKYKLIESNGEIYLVHKSYKLDN